MSAGWMIRALLRMQEFAFNPSQLLIGESDSRLVTVWFEYSTYLALPTIA